MKTTKAAISAAIVGTLLVGALIVILIDIFGAAALGGQR